MAAFEPAVPFVPVPRRPVRARPEQGREQVKRALCDDGVAEPSSAGVAVGEQVETQVAAAEKDEQELGVWADCFAEGQARIFRR